MQSKILNYQQILNQKGSLRTKPLSHPYRFLKLMVCAQLSLITFTKNDLLCSGVIYRELYFNI